LKNDHPSLSVSQTERITEHTLKSIDAELSVLEIGQAANPTVIMVHGLRDSAWSLVPVASELAQASGNRPPLRVLITELRGHGRSSHSAAYAMPNFLLDLHTVIQQLSPNGCALFGHSLGGHITSKFAALFPELVRALIVVEGLGPPTRPHEGDEAMEIQAYRQALLTRLNKPHGTSKPIPSISDVVARLCRNNPRLDTQRAQELAPHLVIAQPDTDTFRWSFDTRASSVFIGSSTADNARFWRQVQAPTCIISGALSFEYWSKEMPAENFTGHFAEGELETRAALFNNHEHHWFAQSGHMVHYDEPGHLAEVCHNFLERNYV
jgi:pimeloyl-ACP methyl ester carboxylesterase